MEGRDSPAGWPREDALRVLNALGTASLLLPQRLSAKPAVLAPLARAVPTNVTLAPLPVQTVLDDLGSVFRSGSSDPD